MKNKVDQKTTQTRKNTGESTPKLQFHSPESSLLTDFSTPIYNMRVTIDQKNSQIGAVFLGI